VTDSERSSLADIIVVAGVFKQRVLASALRGQKVPVSILPSSSGDHVATAVDVCVVGSANIDLTFRAARLPVPGETLAARRLEIGCGGKGANQAVMAALLGARVAFVGRVGSDGFGKRLLDNLQAFGVDTTHTRVDPEQPTGAASIVVDEEARNCIVVAEGANGRLSVADVGAAADVVRAAKVVVAQLETPIDATLEAFRIARAVGARTILNPAPAKGLPDELLKLTDLCIPNESEALVLTQIDTATLEHAAKAARALIDRGPGTVIVTLGDRGCLLVIERESRRYPAWPTTAVDPTGAGDAFTGALAAGLARNIDLGDAIVQASAAAAISVSRPGAQASFPSLVQVKSFMVATADTFEQATDEGRWL
jgi:ribokinase